MTGDSPPRQLHAPRRARYAIFEVSALFAYERDAGAKRRSEFISVEGAERASAARGAPDPVFPARAPAGLKFVGWAKALLRRAHHLRA